MESQIAARDPLEALVWQDTFAEILALMTPDELVVAALRLEGLNDREIGELLGVERAAICHRMAKAQQRIAEQLPDVAGLIAGRAVRTWMRRPGEVPLERGWICDLGDGTSRPVLGARLAQAPVPKGGPRSSLADGASTPGLGAKRAQAPVPGGGPGSSLGEGASTQGIDSRSDGPRPAGDEHAEVETDTGDPGQAGRA